jgi:hypothetical protein
MACGTLPGMEQSTTQSIKVRENRLRRAAARQGLRLVKSSVRDPRAINYGRYWLVAGTEPLTAADLRATMTAAPGVGLDAIEKELTT